MNENKKVKIRKRFEKKEEDIHCVKLSNKTRLIVEKRFFSIITDIRNLQAIDLRILKFNDVDSKAFWFPGHVIEKYPYVNDLSKINLKEDLKEKIKCIIFFKNFFLILSKEDHVYVCTEDCIKEEYKDMLNLYSLYCDHINGGEKDIVTINKGKSSLLLSFVSSFDDFESLEKLAISIYKDCNIKMFYLDDSIEIVFDKIMIFDDIVLLYKERHLFFLVNLLGLTKDEMRNLPYEKLSISITFLLVKNGFGFYI